MNTEDSKMHSNKGSNLKRAIEQKYGKKADFARLMPVSTQGLNNWIKRDGVPPKSAAKAASLLGVSQSEISKIDVVSEEEAGTIAVQQMQDDIRMIINRTTDLQALETARGVLLALLK